MLNTTSAVGLDKQISSDFNRGALVYSIQICLHATAKNPESVHSTANVWRKISSTKQP